MDHIKTENMCSSKDFIKHLPSTGRRYGFATHSGDKNVISKLYKEHLGINNKHKIEKNGQKTKRDT